MARSKCRLNIHINNVGVVFALFPSCRAKRTTETKISGLKTRVTINKEKQRKLTAEFRKNGGTVWQDAEVKAYLLSVKSYMIYLKKKF